MAILPPFARIGFWGYISGNQNNLRIHVEIKTKTGIDVGTLGTRGLQARLRNLNREPMKREAPGFLPRE